MLFRCGNLDPKTIVPEGIIVEGKGDCFYRAIAVAIGGEDCLTNSKEVRRVVREGRTNPDIMGKICKRYFEEDSKHSEQVEKTSHWNQASDILVVSQILQKNIMIHHRVEGFGKMWCKFGTFKPKRGEIYLKHQKKHYLVVNKFTTL